MIRQEITTCAKTKEASESGFVGVEVYAASKNHLQNNICTKAKDH